MQTRVEKHLFTPVLLIDQKEILSADDLIWTGVFSSCWCVHGDRLGISFRGLSSTMLMKVPESFLPKYNETVITEKDGIKEVEIYPYTFIPVNLKTKEESILHDLLRLASLVRNQLNLEKHCKEENKVETHRKLLSHTYNKFISTHQSSVKCFQNYWCVKKKSIIVFQDYNLSILEQLENFKGERSDIFFKRVIPFVDKNPSGLLFTEGSPLDRIHEAVAISYHLFREVNIPKIMEWTGFDEDTIEQYFHQSELVYRDCSSTESLPNEENCNENTD